MAITELHKVFVTTSQSHFRLEVRMKDSYKFQCEERSARWIENMQWIVNEVKKFKEIVRDVLTPIGYKWIEVYKCDGELEDECMVRMSKDGSCLVGHVSGDLHAPFGELAEEKLKEKDIEVEENNVF